VETFFVLVLIALLAAGAGAALAVAGRLEAVVVSVERGDEED